MKKTIAFVALLAVAATTVEPASRETHIEVAAGERVHVVELGSGDAVVFLPGLLGSAYGFRKVTAPIAALGYRVIVVEPLGFGASDSPAGADYSLTAQADRVAVVLERLAVENAVLVGHGVGASVALRIAVRHPARARSVLSLDGGPAEAAATSGVRRAMHFAFLIKLFGSEGRLRRAVRSTLRECSADASWVTDSVVDGYVAASPQGVDGTVDAFRLMARAREPEALVPRLADVRCPVHLVVGDAARDRGISPDEIRILSEGLTSFTMETVPNAGHFLFEEQPHAVIAAVGRACATAPPGGAPAAAARR